MFGLFFGKRSGRVETVYFLYRYVSAYAERFVFTVRSLEIVKIAVKIGCHNYVMSHLCSLDAAGCATPGHNGGIGRHVAFQYFVPTDNLPSFAVEELFDACHAIALQTVLGCMLFVCFQAFRFDAYLTFGALGPAGTGSFVSTDVYKLRREYLGDFCHYIFKKLHALFVADAQYIFKDTPVGRYFVRSSGASHIRIGGQSGKHVSRQVYFGNYGDVTFLCILHDLFGLFLRVEAAIRNVVIFSASCLADNGAVTF